MTPTRNDPGVAPRKFNSVIVPDGIKEPHESGAILQSFFIASLTCFFVIVDGFLLHALDIYVKCGFLGWLSEQIPRCMR